MPYFVSIAERGLVGALGESDSVSHAFHPDGRSCASNSQYAFRFYVGLPRSSWNNETKLRSNPDDTRLQGADSVAGAAVGTDLFVEITDRPDKYLFGQELRSAPIQVPIDAALVICARINTAARRRAQCPDHPH